MARHRSGPSIPARHRWRAGALSAFAAALAVGLSFPGPSEADDRAFLAAPAPGPAPPPVPRPAPEARIWPLAAPAPDAQESLGTHDPPYRQPLPPQPLRIVSWHLDDAKTAGALAMLPEPDRAWRHTFGAERFTPPRSTFDAANFPADVVLIQGLRRAGDARLLFPARDWRLIVSRQALAPVLAQGLPEGGTISRPAPTTAVAIRMQRRLRITGREHVAEVVVPIVDPGGPAESAAALAVRLLADGRPLWVVSADLPDGCAALAAKQIAGAPPPCLPLAALDRWRQQRAAGLAVVLGGRNVRASPAAASNACVRQSIVSPDGGREAHARDEPALGCIARLEWP